MRAGRIVMIVVGSLVALIGFGMLVGGAGALIGYATQREDGYFRTGTVRLASPSYAITSDHVDLASEPGPSDWLIDRGALGTVKIDLDPARPDVPLFAGIAPSDDVDAYLDGVARDQIRDIDLAPDRVVYRRLPGGAPSSPPADETFWVAQVTATEADELTWEVENGDWTVVMMNADASRGVDLEARLGIKVDWFLPAAIVLAVLGLGLLAGGTTLIVVGGRGLARPPEEEPVTEAPAPAGSTTEPVPVPAELAAAPRPSAAAAVPAVEGYPLSFSGHVDPHLSRGLWLVKWLLALPHYVVLVFLWIAFVVATVVAFFAILFTGRYPRGLLDFNVGVMRWSWRVGFYSYSALGTDRYPPFTLGPSDYPAELTLEPPGSLSRGLVLVKWWLLAIPHYLVIGVIGTGWWLGWWTPFGWWDDDRSTWVRSGGLGLVGLLVLFAGVALLFSGRYPSGIFAFVMGLNRWVYRVVAYATLMTDRYPPFRLDQGGADPSVPLAGGPHDRVAVPPTAGDAGSPRSAAPAQIPGSAGPAAAETWSTEPPV